MKKIIQIFVITFFVISCKAQKIVIETRSKDILVFGFNDENIKLINKPESLYIPDKKTYKSFDTKHNTEIYNKQRILVISQNWSGYGSHYLEKKYSFIREKDTMNIKCKCGQERNYYFKNFTFKKGYYELSFTYSKDKIFGSEIKTTKEIQNTLFKNSYVSDENPTQKDKYFKDLKFIEIDLKDTTNVKLKRID
ncbi:hypothetical protein [Flavobacterium covae]|uniref:hypothetical protein n=1 Tax=Flavobacterium covae TaxID=2906076 RepID=UPI003393BADB